MCTFQTSAFRLSNASNNTTKKEGNFAMSSTEGSLPISCSMQAFSNIRTVFPEKITLKWIYLYTKMRYYADSCVEMPNKCLLQSAFNHCNWESELRKLWHVWGNMEKWTYFCQAADTSHQGLFIFRDQQWHHNLVCHTQVCWEPRVFNC